MDADLGMMGEPGKMDEPGDDDGDVEPRDVLYGASPATVALRTAGNGGKRNATDRRTETYALY